MSEFMFMLVAISAMVLSLSYLCIGFIQKKQYNLERPYDRNIIIAIVVTSCIGFISLFFTKTVTYDMALLGLCCFITGPYYVYVLLNKDSKFNKVLSGLILFVNIVGLCVLFYNLGILNFDKYMTKL